MAPTTRSALNRSKDEKSSSTRRGKKCYSADMEKHNYGGLKYNPAWEKFKTTAKEIHKSDPDMCRSFRKMFDQFHSYKKWRNGDSFVKAVSESFPEYPQFVEALSELLKANPMLIPNTSPRSAGF
ncbi:unnamed protein product [Cuscuta epithymum]|uniref:Uncharacterized protein n=1 Tax=Cuscuta epithymum TaxID=186058 RepID=A0AAV0G4P7_9ASTE|nr:unnamed protein product [Cuscuta epithymum]